MVSGNAWYLLRFDDICPTMNWDVWETIEAELLSLDIKPMLAVVPQNLDSALQVGRPRANFWDCVRRWQSAGWTIGLHGYQHLYVTKCAGFFGRADASEFAGLDADEQRHKIQQGLDIFRAEGIRADIWIAPGHSFDRTTVDQLRRFGITCISDGFGRYPHEDDQGVFWIPQQLTQFLPKRDGVWTVCFHHNSWLPSDCDKFIKVIREYREHILSVPQVLFTYRGRRVNWRDRLHAGGLHLRYRVRKYVRR